MEQHKNAGNEFDLAERRLQRLHLLKENFGQVPDQLYYAVKVDGTSALYHLYEVGEKPVNGSK